jgi:hypothetical protein
MTLKNGLFLIATILISTHQAVPYIHSKLDVYLKQQMELLEHHFELWQH